MSETSRAPGDGAAMPVNEGEGKPAIPVRVRALLERMIGEELYPPAAYPRRWFPGLDAMLLELFRGEWHAREGFRQRLLAAEAPQAAALVEGLLGLPALLADRPQAVVMIYRHLIAGFVRRRHYRHEEREDILQEMLSRILADKMTRIQKKYDARFSPRPSFTSYFMICVRNIYMDVVREGRSTMLQREGEPREAPERILVADGERVMEKAVLEEEFFRVRSILRLHPTSRGRIVLCLKLRFRLPVAAEDVRRCFPGCSPADMDLLRQDFRRRKDRDLFQAVAPVFNRHEPVPIQADTLRRWTENKTAAIITMMNRIHQAPVYDADRIADLLSLFFTANDAHE